MVRAAVIYTFGVVFFLLFGCHKTEKKVPIISSKLNKLEIRKQLDSFLIFNHLNQKINLSDFKGEVQLINFFFTSCATICPDMEKELRPIIKHNKDKNIVFLSVTIDPEHDNIFVLNDHANNAKTQSENRFFIRTTPKDLEQVAKLYLSEIKTDGDGLFYHTSHAVLLDVNLNIRGLYDLLNPQEIAFLEEDINVLLME